MKLAIPAAVVAGCVSAACTVTVDSHSEIVRDEKRFAVSGVPDVRVSTFDGSIEIQSWDKPEVLVEIERRGPSRAAIERIDIRAGQKDGIVEVDVKRPRSESFTGIGIHRTAYARLFVWVPRSVALRARSGDGAITAERLEGRLDLGTSDGRIRVADVAGDLTFETADGSVTVDGARGRLAVETADGTVNVRGSLERLFLHTADGSVTYRAEAGSTMTAPWEITTGDGSVSLFLPPDFNAELDARTGDGRITNELQVEKPRGDSGRVRRSLRAQVGAGGQLLKIRTGDGAIRLRAN